MNAASENAKHSSNQVADAVPPIRTMHDDVETWTDTCSCEPETRWQAVAEALDERTRAGMTTNAMPDSDAPANESPPSRHVST
jgi:hypothetical protein